MIFAELFTTFFFIGLFTIGGGYAMLSLIQTQVVNVHEWITESMFTDIVGISQMTPGPIGINSATYIGYSVIKEAGMNEALCVLGSFTASFAVVLPSFLIVLAIVKAYSKFKNNESFQYIMSNLKPVVTGLIGAAAILLITKENFPDWRSWVLFAAALVASIFFKAGPITIIILGGIAGYFIY